MALCSWCDSESFDITDGLFFCSQCGTQSQDVRQEEDYNYGLTTLNVSRGSSSKQSVQTAAGKTSRGSEPCTVWDWNEAFQWVLKKQVEALIDLGFDRKLKEVVAQLWFAYLRHLNIAFTNKPHSEARRLYAKVPKRKQKSAAKKSNQKEIRKAKVAKFAESASDSDSGDEEDASCQSAGNKKKPRVSFNVAPQTSKDSTVGDEPRNISSRNDINSDREPLTPYSCSDTECPSSDDSFSDLEIPDALKDAMKNGVNKTLGLEKRAYNHYRLQSMCKEIPVVICYVALLCLKQDVLEIDMVRWVRSQRVPYLDMLSCLPPHMQLSGYVMNQNFRPFAAIEANELSFHVKRLILTVKLPRSCIPPVDCGAVCQRLVSELLLPDHIYQIVTGLLRIHTPDCIFPYYYDSRGNEPSGVAGMCMAVIVIAMKMCYGLDGVQEFDCRCPDVDMGWCEWLQIYSQHLVKQHKLSKPANILSLVTDCSLYLTAWDYHIPQRPRGMKKSAAKSVPHCAEIFRKVGQSEKLQQSVAEPNSVTESAPTTNPDHKSTIPASRYTPLSKQRTVFHFGSGEVANSYRLFIGICASLIEIRTSTLHGDIVLQERMYMQHIETVHQRPSHSTCLPS